MPKRSKTAVAGTDELNQSPTHLLHRAEQQANNVTDRVLRLYNLTQRKYVVLLILMDGATIAQNKLMRLTGIDRSTLADMLARMVGEGLLVSEQSPEDRRANLITITKKGSQVIANVLPEVKDTEQRLIETLPVGDRDVFLRCLQVLADQVRR